MKDGDMLKVVTSTASSSLPNERVQVHPSVLKALKIHTANPVVIQLEYEGTSTIRIANIWPRSTLAIDEIHIPSSLQHTPAEVTYARLHSLWGTGLSRAIEVDVEVITFAKSQISIDAEALLLLECSARELLVNLQYVTQGQIFKVALPDRQYDLTISRITIDEEKEAKENSDMPSTILPAISSSARVSRSTQIRVHSRDSKAEVKAREDTALQSTKLQEESAYATLGGLDRQIDELKRLVEMPLRRPEVFRRYGLKPPRGLLLYGPPGTGKTTLAYSAARSCVDDSSIEIISGPELTSSLHGGTERALRKVFARAKRKSPSVVIIDEIDALAPRRDGADASTDGAGEVEKRVVATLLTLMDGLSGDQDESRVVVIAATNRPNAIDPALRRPGRLDREIEVGIPTSDARLAILTVLLAQVPHTLTSTELLDIANRTHGYVGADLSALVREAGMRAVSRDTFSEGVLTEMNRLSMSDELVDGQESGLTYADFQAAQIIIRPSAMREISLELPKVSWDDVAPGKRGLQIQQKIRECVEWPLKHKDTLQRLGITAPRGVLLYGPPGCSKTLIARALASESGLNFVAVKGPELLNKYVGESERALREVFRKARAASPSIIFFDEIDGLTTTRGAESASSDKIIATLLNEMDGIEQLADVLVVAATNRPEVIDPALLRPGRLDRLLYVAPPDLLARRQILAIRGNKMALHASVDLDKIAQMTDGCSGAEMVSICQEAGLQAMNDDLAAQYIEQHHLEHAAIGIKRRITSEMIKKYESWRDQIVL